MWFPESLGRLLEVPESQLIALATVLNQIQKTLGEYFIFWLTLEYKIMFSSVCGHDF